MKVTAHAIAPTQTCDTPERGVPCNADADIRVIAVYDARTYAEPGTEIEDYCARHADMRWRVKPQ